MLRIEASQVERLARLRELYKKRGEEFAASRPGDSRRTRSGGTSYYYAAIRPENETGPALRKVLRDIADGERTVLTAKMEKTRFFAARADRLTDYLSWLGGRRRAMAIFLGAVACRRCASTPSPGARRKARRSARGARASGGDRTRELSDANAALKAEAIEREAARPSCARSQKKGSGRAIDRRHRPDFNNMLAVVVGGIDLARRSLSGPRREVLIHLTNAMEGATRAAALTAACCRSRARSRCCPNASKARRWSAG